MTQSEDIESENNQAFFLKYFVDEPEPHPRFRRGWRAAVLPGHEAGGHVGGIELCQ